MLFRSRRHAMLLTCLLLLSASFAIGQPVARAAETNPDDISLVERSSDIFIGAIDIVTATTELVIDGDGESGPGLATEYTVLVSDVLKGKLAPPSIIVVRQDGGVSGDRAGFHEGDGPLIPGNAYLFFARYVGVPAYQITDPGAGNVPITSPEQRAALVAYWSGIIEQTACPVTDVLKLDGVVYARREWNDDRRFLERAWVGPGIATIQERDATATGCRVDLADRSASVIPVGTKIHALKRYAPSFRVAVRLPDGRRYLYEAIRSEKAQTGADLLDIRDRVTGLEAERWFECDDTADCVSDVRSVRDPVQINHVMDWVLDARVDVDRANWRRIPPNWVRLTFTLDDSSTVTLWVDRESGWSQSGIRVPGEEIVEDRWDR